MTRSGVSASVVSSAPPGKGGVLLAWISTAAACVVLLAIIPYCPTYSAARATLVQLFLGTFWPDLSGQISGMFSGTPKASLSGEATASEWTYCGMVPLIVAGLVWYLWPKIKAAPKQGHPAGYVILGAGFLFYVMGFLMENYYVGIGATEWIYAGLIILFLGWAIMRILIFPWLFLLFMWPYNFLEDLALELRLLMSSLSHYVLQIIGVANQLNGTAIVSTPGSAHPFAIDIADPCSGIRSLFAVVMIAALYGFVTFDKWWKQGLIVLLAVPLVILGNLVRIILLTLGTIHLGEPFALGTNAEPSWFHEGAGYLVYIINLGGLVLVGSWLARLTSSDKAHAKN